MWLLPPYLYLLRQMSSEIDLSLGTIQKWRQELVNNGHSFENDKQKMRVVPVPLYSVPL